MKFVSHIGISLCIFLFLGGVVCAQQIRELHNVKGLAFSNFFLADDYGNLYSYDDAKLSFTKYDTLGKKRGELLWAVPFTVDSVQNPLCIALFSENAQELIFADRNLAYIQDPIALSPNFGYVKALYAEDFRFLWLLDQSTHRLIQYDLRENKTLMSFPFDIDFGDILQMIVRNDKVYLIRPDAFEVYNQNAKLLFKRKIENLKHIRRENRDIYINTPTTFWKYEEPENLQKVFEKDGAKFVTKNYKNWFAIVDNLLYVY